MPITLNASDYNLCWGLCNQTGPTCVAWAYCDTTTGCNIPKPLCYLKGADDDEVVGGMDESSYVHSLRLGFLRDAASVEPWEQNSCRVAGIQESGTGPAAFQGVYYENVDTIDAPVLF